MAPKLISYGATAAVWPREFNRIEGPLVTAVFCGVTDHKAHWLQLCFVGSLTIRTIGYSCVLWGH